MIPAVFDASVAVKACLPVPGHEQALAAIRCYAMVAPAFIVTEVANAIWKYHRNGDIDGATSLDIIRNFAGYPDIRPDLTLQAEALQMACELDHPVYDCLYMTLARRDGLPLISADKRMVRIANDQLGLHTIPLSTIPIEDDTS